METAKTVLICIDCKKPFNPLDNRGIKPLRCKPCKEVNNRKQRAKSAMRRYNYDGRILEFFALAHLEADRLLPLIFSELYGGESY